MSESTPDRRFPARMRLQRDADFARVFARRCTASDVVLRVYVAENGLDWSRIGIRVGKRAARSAVRRNAIRRRIREAFRLSQAELPAGFDIVCAAQTGAAPDYAAIQASLVKLVVTAAVRSRRSATGSTRQPNPGTPRN